MTIKREECRRIEPLLDDFVDGRLSAADQRRVGAHIAGYEDDAGYEDLASGADVAGCADCGERLASLERLLEQVDALPRALPPESDLWAGIESRLTVRRPRAVAGGWPGWLRQAAAAVVWMALGGVLSQLVMSDWRSDRAVSVAAIDSGQAEARIDADFALAEADFLRAKESLWSAVYSSHDVASSETREVVERNLAVIAGAIRELRTALEADPGNHQLEGLLLAQHRSEIGLLQRLARATEI